ncbi:unnamed protein product [Orchesella dallaii]|uniref:Uncharacterized protein n=1 Tax=Orchesella dallaii TaxID=48710 RepID=A0ABP1R695_9HEXA
MILMDSRFRESGKKEEDHSHQQNNQPNSRKGAEELTGGSKSNSSSPPSVFGGIGFQMTTPIMQNPTKWLLQQPATQPPPFRPLIPTSQLLFPGLPTLEMEGLKIFDPEPEPILPFPGEPENWTHYGVYLQELSAYNATEIKIPHNMSSVPNPNSDNGIATSTFSKTGGKTSKSFASLTSSTNSSLPLSALTLKNLKIAEESKPPKDTAKLESEEEKKEKRRVYFKGWYEQNKEKRKVAAQTEEQKAKRQSRLKAWYEQNRGKGKLTEKQRERVNAQSRLRYQAKKKLAPEQRKVEMEDESRMNSSYSSSSYLPVSQADT